MRVADPGTRENSRLIFGRSAMQGEVKERWMHLCGLAAEEKDPVRLRKLIHQICELLDAKQRRLDLKPPEPPQKTT
jgi:hypothetical protein